MDMENKIIEKLVEIDQKIDVLKDEIAARPTREEVMGGFDEQQVVLQRLDQERLFMIERIKRVEEDVEHVKEVLHIT